MHNRIWVVLFSTFTMTACSSTPDPAPNPTSSSSGGPLDNLAVCQKQRDETTPDGKQVVVCEEAFAEAPYIHLPEDSAMGPQRTVFAGLVPSDESAVWSTRSGDIPVQTGDKALIFNEIEAASGEFSNRYAYAIYEVTVDGSDQTLDVTLESLSKAPCSLTNTWQAGRSRGRSEARGPR
jgi:hypothetical protein